LLMPVTWTALVLTGMGSIRVFDLVTLLAGPAHTTDTLAFHMYQSTFGLYRFAMGATIGFFMIFLSIFLVVPYLRSMEFEAER
jgi:raffinose/stachyose/melibiose transport system permease protein